MKVFISARIDAQQVKRLEANGFTIKLGGFGQTGVKMDEESFMQELSGVEVVIFEFENMTERVLQNASSLKVIACLRNEPEASTDIAAARHMNIPVLFTPGRNAVAVAEYTLGLMLSIARSIPTTHHLLRYTDQLTAVSYTDKSGEKGGVTSEWSLDPGAPFQRFQGSELMGKTVGLVGAGFIGQEIAKRVLALGMKVIAFDPYASVEKLREAAIESVDLDHLAEQSDFVVMAAKVTPESKGVFSKKYFDQMKQSAFFINTARAALVDYEALTDALERGAIAGAALDVYPVEPLPDDSKLRQLSNVVLSPHLAGATREVVLHHSTMVVDDLLTLKAGQSPSRIINPEVIQHFVKNGGLT